MSEDMRKMIDKMKHIERFINEAVIQHLSEGKEEEIKLLQKQLKNLNNWFINNTPLNKTNEKIWNEKDIESAEIRRKLYQLTGESYGETKEKKSKKSIEPKGLYGRYDHPNQVPISVYKWIFKNTSLLTTDATDAVRWSRIINTEDDRRYPQGEITIYRAVDNPKYSEIREGDWVTTDKEYAINHNNKYFDGKGKIISMVVNGEDVLVSPTGNYEEAIYAPLEYSIDIIYI